MQIAPRPGEALLLLLGVGVSLALAEGAVRIAGAGAPRPTGYAPVNTRRPEAAWTNSLGYRDNAWTSLSMAASTLPRRPGAGPPWHVKCPLP